MKKIKILALLLLGFLLLSYKLNKPFIGHHDWNAVFYAKIAQNTRKFGFLKTKFGAVYPFLNKTETNFKYHTHQPPLLHLLLGLEAKIIGVQEWSMRLLTIIFTLTALYFFFKIGEFLFNKKTAFVASLFFIFNPMFLYFGKLPVHETFGLPWLAFSIYRYMIFFQKDPSMDSGQERKNFFYLVLGLIIGCQTIWSAYYLVPLFIIHYFLFAKNAKKKPGRRFYWIILIPLVSFLSHLIHSFILKEGFDKGLFSTLLFRMQIGKKATTIYGHTIFQYIKQEILWLTVYFTSILCILNLIYYFLLAKKMVRRRINFRDGFLLIIIIIGFIDPIIFRNLCFIHDYKLYYFLLSIPLLAAAFLFYLKQRLEFIWRKNNFITTCLFCFIFTVFATERFKFTKTLFNTSINKPAYDLGLIIKEKSDDEEIVLVGSKSFAEFQNLFLDFYSQRKIIYFEPNLKEFEKLNSSQIGLVVFVKEREKPTSELLSYLKGNYSFFEKGEFWFFDLR